MVEELKELAEKEESRGSEAQIQELSAVAQNQAACYRDDLRYMTEATKKIGLLLEECRQMVRSEEIQSYGK